jgi:dTDP-4-amino-4,6-dideoxygalactose transaminase
MSDTTAAFIMMQFARFQPLVERHRDIWKELSTQIIGSPARTLRFSGDGIPFCGIFPVVFPTPRKLLNSYTRKYYEPIGAGYTCRVAHDLFERMICYPIHTDLSDKDVKKILDDIVLRAGETS